MPQVDKGVVVAAAFHLVVHEVECIASDYPDFVAFWELRQNMSAEKVNDFFVPFHDVDGFHVLFR